MVFDIRSGEVHALLGENGAGKSTLMKILSGVYQKDEGEIFFEGQPVIINGPLAAQKLGISIIHQEFNLCNDLTVAQNIFIGREHRKGNSWLLNDHSHNLAAEKILNTLNLDIAPDTQVSSLTVAQQQIVVRANPDLVAVYGTNEGSSMGVATAIQSQSLTGKIKVVGFDASDAIVNFIQTGVMQGVVVQDAFQIGYQGLITLHDVLEGKDEEKVIDVPAVVVTGDNINDEDIQKIINPLG